MSEGGLPPMDGGEAGGYSVTIWQRLREGPLFYLFCAGVVGLVLGVVLSNAALETVCAYGAGVALVLYVVAGGLELRADLCYDRSHPEVERDDA